MVVVAAALTKVHGAQWFSECSAVVEASLTLRLMLHRLGKQRLLLLLWWAGVEAVLQLQPKSARAATTMLRLMHENNVLMITRDKPAIVLQPLQEVRDMWGV